MAMTAAVKDEISRLPVTRTCCRKAEVSAVLRFAGGLHLVSGRIVIEAELDTAMAARRLKRDILEIFGHTSELIVMAPGGLRRGSRYVVRVVAGGDVVQPQDDPVCRKPGGWQRHRKILQDLDAGPRRCDCGLGLCPLAVGQFGAGTPACLGVALARAQQDARHIALRRLP